MGFEVTALAFPDASVLSQDRQRVDDFLARFGIDKAADDPFQDVEFADGGTLTCYVPKLSEQLNIDFASFKFHGFTESMVGFVHEFAKLADLCLTESGGGSVIFINEEQQQRCPSKLQSAFTHAVVCNTSEEMWSHLSSGMAAFMKLRNRILGEDEGPKGDHTATDGPGEWKTFPVDLAEENE